MVGKKTPGERVFDAFNVLLIGALSLIFLYPLWHSLCASFSEPIELIKNSSLIWKPFGFSLDGYKIVLHNPNILSGYANTLFILTVGTAINMLLTITSAYALSRRGLYLKKLVTVMIVFTMYFGGGLIPTYLVVKSVGLYNSTWALILPNAVATWNLIVMKTAFQRIPPSLDESAMLDGANDFVILFRIILPVAKATVAVILLFYAVSHWNAWFGASIYLRDRSKYPLQLVMREILIASQQQNTSGAIDASMSESLLVEIVVRYATIIVATVPILCIYPFVQKYFVTGVMMGSIKE